MDKATYNKERIAVQHRKAKFELCEARNQLTIAESRWAAAEAAYELIDSCKAFNEGPYDIEITEVE